MKKVVLLFICIFITCVFIACSSSSSNQDLENNYSQSAQQSPSQSQNQTSVDNLYEKYAGSYMLYSIEYDGEMRYVGDFFEDNLLTLYTCVIELYENKNGKFIFDGYVSNLTWTATNGKINILLESNGNNLLLNINNNTLSFDIEGIFIRLRKTYL